MQSISSWQQAASTAQSRRDGSIGLLDPPLPSIGSEASLGLNVSALPDKLLDQVDNAITNLPPEQLLESLKSAELSCQAVVNAYLRRAGLAQQLVNCLTELLPEQAVARAAQLDAHLKQHGKPIGPLHGLPVSLKEHVGLKGLRTNGAYCALLDRVAPNDAAIVSILWKAGVVFYCRTTMPQTTMHLETASNLYGTTVNPFNRSLTAGGSSGGEGALMGLHGSCMGIGSDIGGSIRSPAANNGVYGLRPTAQRLPVAGVALDMDGMEQILCVIGPLSTSVAGLNLFMQAVLAAQPWLAEPSLAPMPWRAAQLPPKLRVAIMHHDGVVQPHPPVRRALRDLAAALATAPDIELSTWTPYAHDHAWKLIASLFYPDGGAADAAVIAQSGEPWLPLSSWILRENPHVRRLDAEGIWAATAARDAYRAAYAARWNATAQATDGATGAPADMVDVILCPAGPGAAPPLEHARYWGYTAQWNLLDYPAAVFPVTRVDAARDVVDTAFEPLGEQDAWNHALYTGPERYKDAPVGLQLVGRRFEDEKVLAAVARIEKYVRPGM